MKKIIFFLLFLVLSVFVNAQELEIRLRNTAIDGIIPLEIQINQITYWDSIVLYYKTIGNYERLTTLYYNTLSYNDTVHCESNRIKYRADLYFNGSQLFNGFSSLISENDPIPKAPILDSVSFVNGQLTLGWTNIPDFTLKNFLVYKHTSSNYEIGQVDDANATFFAIDNSELSPCNEQHKIILVAKDHCNASPNLQLEYAQAISQINNLTWDKCDESITIDISDYITSSVINQEILKHQIWVSVNSGQDELLGEIEPGQNFIHQGVTYNNEYNYYIRTFLKSDNGEATSTSCSKSITTDALPLPNQLTLRNSSVIPGTNSIHTTIGISGQSDLDRLVLLRSNDGENFNVIKQTIWDNQSEFTIVDETASPSDESYYYKVGLMDECDNLVDSTDNVLRTMHLSIEQLEDKNILSWNAFEGNPVSIYNLYRFEEGNIDLNLEPIYSKIILIGPYIGNMEYADESIDLDEGASQWNYIVETKLINSNLKSYSNIVSTNFESIVKIANAFRPASIINPIFKPIFSSIAPNGYSFKIFNRWGQLIFTTENPEEGWNGMLEGELVQQGVYIYQVSYIDNNNKSQTIKGTVTLVN